MTFRLCYVDGHKVYFANRKIFKQFTNNPWQADDFNGDEPKWRIQEVVVAGKFKKLNYKSTIEIVNKGQTPCLTYELQEKSISIVFGITLDEFTKLINILCPRCNRETNNDFGEDCRLHVEIMGGIESLRFMCDDCAIWAWSRLDRLLKRTENEILQEETTDYNL